jgi:hypothetical protein
LVWGAELAAEEAVVMQQLNKGLFAPLLELSLLFCKALSSICSAKAPFFVP